MSTKCSYKYYFVPNYKNTTINNPNIYFFNVPLDKNIRFKWYKRVHREEIKLKQISKARLSCCEDHFCVSIICTITIE